MCWICNPANRNMLANHDLLIWKACTNKLWRGIRYPVTGGHLHFLTPLFFFDPQQRSFQSILVGTQFSLPFNRQNSFTHFCFHLSPRTRQTELLQFKLRGRQQGSGFPTVLQAASANPGMAADCPVRSALCSHIGLFWGNGAGCFTHTQIQIQTPPLCLQPSYLLVCALLGSHRKCLVLLPQFP